MHKRGLCRRAVSLCLSRSYIVLLTSSPAVTERPRDASCLSVVSFNSTIRRAQSSIISHFGSSSDLSLRTITFCSVLFSSSWSSIVVVINKIHWCMADCAVNCTVDCRSCCLHFSSHRSDSQIFVENRDFYIPHLHSTPSLGGSQLEYCHSVCCGKPGMVWLPDGENFWKIRLVISTESTNVTDRRTDTAWRHRPRLCIASRGKKEYTYP